MTKWLTRLADIVDQGQSCVLVTVAGTRGSTPRETGAKMIVTATESYGSIGGGQLEYLCIQAACEWLQPDASDLKTEEQGRTRLQRFPLGANCGQCCGGVADILFEEITAASGAWIKKLVELATNKIAVVMVTARQSRKTAEKYLVTNEHWFSCSGAGDRSGTNSDQKEPPPDLLKLARESLNHSAKPLRENLQLSANVELPLLIEPVASAKPHIVLFGAGHVGSACVAVLSLLDVEITLIDSRDGFLEGGYPENVNPVNVKNPAAAVQGVPTDAYYLIMTHDHALDLAICGEVLQRTDYRYCGLIGSLSKRRRFEKRLRTLGLSESQLAGLTCPIGSTEINGKKPGEIAIAVAAQLLPLFSRTELTLNPPMRINI